MWIAVLGTRLGCGWMVWGVFLGVVDAWFGCMAAMVGVGGGGDSRLGLGLGNGRSSTE